MVASMEWWKNRITWLSTKLLLAFQRIILLSWFNFSDQRMRKYKEFLSKLKRCYKAL
jgi:hypothetical protein